jgi:hypothetical protein
LPRCRPAVLPETLSRPARKGACVIASASASCLLLTTVLFAPLVALELRLGQTYMVATFASTAAVVVANPPQYEINRRRIARCYAVAFLVSAAVYGIGTAFSVPAIAIAASAAAAIIALPSSRFHPPVAGVPFALALTPASQVLTDWGVLAGSTAYLLLALIPLARRLCLAAQAGSQGAPIDFETCAGEEGLPASPAGHKADGGCELGVAESHLPGLSWHRAR